MFVVLHILWAAISLGLFRTVRGEIAVWPVLLGGWLVLPPAGYAAAGDPDVLPFWIIGSALPSDLFFSKAWIAPAIAAACSILFDRARWHGLRLTLADVPLLLFCAWPSVQALLVRPADPGGLASTVYIAGVWALPWLIAKLYLRTGEDARRLAGTLALLSLVLLPVALAEGATGWRLHTALLGAHPFAFDGIERYAGYRPQALFEHGNQYGIWCAGAALAACWRLGAEPGGKSRAGWIAAAGILLAMTLASQSAGAILLLFAGYAMLALRGSFAMARQLFPYLAAFLLLLSAVHVSGIVPLRSLANETMAGQMARDMFRAAGRQSLPWRIGQDLKSLPIIQDRLLTGHARWDWFREAGTRPWGLPLLVLGQFGLIGFIWLVAALGGTFFCHLRRAARDGAAPARLYAVLLLLFGADALLNSFLFLPALLLTGACGASPRRGTGEVGCSPRSRTILSSISLPRPRPIWLPGERSLADTKFPLRPCSASAVPVSSRPAACFAVPAPPLGAHSPATPVRPARP